MIAIPIAFSLLYGFVFLAGIVVLIVGGKNRNGSRYEARSWLGGLFISAFFVGLIRILEGTWGPFTVAFMMWILLSAGIQAMRIGNVKKVTRFTAFSAIVISSVVIWSVWHIYAGRH